MIVSGKEGVSWRTIALLLALACTAAASWGLAQMRRIDALQGQLAATKEELAVANGSLEQALKRELPITVSYSGSSASGLVASLRSDFPRPLEVVAMCSSPRTTQRKRFNLVIPAQGAIEIGAAEGWRFMPGHRIILSNAAFRPAEYVVPEH